MKAKTLVTLIVLLLFASACKKNSGRAPDPVDNTPNIKLKYLVKEVRVDSTSVKDKFTTITTYSYDSKKRLSTIKSGNSITTYTYNDDNNIFSISKITVDGINNSQGYTEFNYDDKKLSSATVKYFKNGVNTDEIPYTYVYTGDKITEVHHGGLYYDLYTYDANNNLIKIFYHGSPDYEANWTYDDKKSRFTASLIKHVNGLDLAGDRFSPNNRNATIDHIAGTTLITYTYDTDGYPVTAAYANRSSNGAYVVPTKFTYTYSTLD